MPTPLTKYIPSSSRASVAEARGGARAGVRARRRVRRIEGSVKNFSDIAAPVADVIHAEELRKNALGRMSSLSEPTSCLAAKKEIQGRRV